MEIKMLHGGKMPKSSDDFEYVDGFVTDTRLMGVLGLYLHFKQKLEDSDPCDCFFFLYFDIEELGLDTVKVFFDLSDEDLKRTIKSSFGGLGAKMIPVSMREGIYLANLFVKRTLMLQRKLPELRTLSFVLEKTSDLNKEEIDSLNKKMCPELNDYGVVNYYLMRCFGKDLEGAGLLYKGDDKPGCIAMAYHSTFLKNEIWKKDGAYFSKSLVESKNNYYIVRTRLFLEDEKVKSAELLSRFHISETEAALILSKSEYVDLYDILVPGYVFNLSFMDYSLGFDKTRHFAGDMYLQFYENNNHALRREFNLSDDIKCIYFVSDQGQLIVGVSTKKEIENIEKEIENSNLNNFLDLDEQYEFDQSIIYEFALSGIGEFKSFLESSEE